MDSSFKFWNVSRKEDFGNEDLFLACKNQNHELLWKVLQCSSVDVNGSFDFMDVYGYVRASTPILFASEHGLRRIVIELLKNDLVDVNKGGEGNNFTPLEIACHNNRLSVIKELLLHPDIDIDIVRRRLMKVKLSSRIQKILASFKRQRDKYSIQWGKRMKKRMNDVESDPKLLTQKSCWQIRNNKEFSIKLIEKDYRNYRFILNEELMFDEDVIFKFIEQGISKFEALKLIISRKFYEIKTQFKKEKEGIGELSFFVESIMKDVKKLRKEYEIVLISSKTPKAIEYMKEDLILLEKEIEILSKYQLNLNNDPKRINEKEETEGEEEEEEELSVSSSLPNLHTLTNRELEIDVSKSLLLVIQYNPLFLKRLRPSIRKNLEFVREVVRIDGKNIQYVDKPFRNNRIIVLEAVKNNGLALEFCSSRMRSELEVVLEAVNQNGQSLVYVDIENRKSRDFLPVVYSAVRNSPKIFSLIKSDETFLKNKEIILLGIKFIKEKNLAKEIRLFKNVCFLPFGHSDPMKYRLYKPEKLNHDSNRVKCLFSVATNGHYLEDCKEEYRSDFSFVKYAVENFGWSIQYASEELKDDPKIARIAVERSPLAYGYIGKKLKNDRSFIIRLMRINHRLFEFCEEKMKDDEEVVIEVIKRNKMLIRFASMRLRRNKKVLFSVMRFWDDPFFDIPGVKEMQNDREFILESVKKNGRFLYFGSDELRDDDEIVTLALKNQPEAIKYISKRLKDDINIVRLSINSGYGLVFCSKRLKNDKLWVLEVVKRNGYEFHYAGERIKKDEEVQLAALRQNGDAVKFMKNLGNEKKIIAASKLSTQLEKINKKEYFREKWRVMNTVRINGHYLEDVEGLRNDKEVVYESVKYFGWSLQYAGQKMKNDYDILTTALQHDGFNIKLANSRAWKNKKMKRIALAQIFGGNGICDILDEFFKAFGGNIAVLEEISNGSIGQIQLGWARKIYIGKGIVRSGREIVFIPHGYGFELTKAGSFFSISSSKKYVKTFSGYFSNGLREGKGKEFDLKTRNISFEGDYKNGLRNGKGKEYFTNNIGYGLQFEGLYKDGKKHGRGELYDFRTHQLIDGEWKNGKITGEIFNSFDMPILPYEQIRNVIFRIRDRNSKTDVLGHGSFGVVYNLPKTQIIISQSQSNQKNYINKKNWGNNDNVAIKVFKREITTSRGKRDILLGKIRSFIRICGRLEKQRKDKHILKTFALFVGAFEIAYVMEKCLYSVDDIISSSNFMVSVKDKLRYIKETALGMKSLHSINVMHRDLKWGNVLIDYQKNVKITDFESIKEDSRYWKNNIMNNATGKLFGTPSFYAPERLTDDYGCSCDVFSFGLMIYCLLFEKLDPFNGLECCGRSKDTMDDYSLIRHISECDFRPSITKKMERKIDKKYHFLFDIIVSCWQKDPNKRLTFGEIVQILERKEKEESAYVIIRVIEKRKKVEKELFEKESEKLFLLKGSYDCLKKTVEKKFGGRKIVKMENTIQKKYQEIRNDNDVIELLENDQPLILVEFDDIIKKNKDEEEEEEEEMEEKEEESLREMRIRMEEMMRRIDDLETQNQILLEEKKKDQIVKNELLKIIRNCNCSYSNSNVEGDE